MHVVSLKKALTGFPLTVTTLSGQDVALDLKVVTPTTKRVIKGEGLPLPKSPNERGDLIVEFDIQFPRNLTTEQKNSLANILPD